MSQFDIVRAWKDEDYLNSLSEEQRSQLPENPAGMVEISDEEMEIVAGGGKYSYGGSYSANFTKEVSKGNCTVNNTVSCNVVSNFCKVKGSSFLCGDFRKYSK